MFFVHTSSFTFCVKSSSRGLREQMQIVLAIHCSENFRAMETLIFCASKGKRNLRFNEHLLFLNGHNWNRNYERESYRSHY